MIISFAWTTPALLAGVKTVTRRDWTVPYANKVNVSVQAGKLFDAYDKTPRAHGKIVARVRVHGLYLEHGYWMTDEDRAREGITWSEQNGIAVPDRHFGTWDAWWRQFRAGWAEWGGYRVDFELVERVT